MRPALGPVYRCVLARISIASPCAACIPVTSFVTTCSLLLLVTRAGIRGSGHGWVDCLSLDALRPRSDAGTGERGGWAARMRSVRPASDSRTGSVHGWRT